MNTKNVKPPRQPAKIITAVRAVAAFVPCDPRTVLRAIDGGGLAMNRDRVLAAVETLGLAEVFATRDRKDEA